jgi:hypothetical protein
MLIIAGCYGTIAGNCQAQRDEVMPAGQGTAAKAELNDSTSQKVTKVPYVNATGETIPLVADTQIVGIKETVTGLKEAGYSLNEIAVVLKNDKKSAPEISVACLRAGYNGTKVFEALQRSGFSSQAAEAAVPPALRTQGQLFSVHKNNPDSAAAEMAMIEPNPLRANTVKDTVVPVLQENRKTASTINPIEVPVSVGVTFNGLSNWNSFQNERFGVK